MRDRHGWSGTPLPPDWDRRRLQALQRDRYQCQECGGQAREVDHRVPVSAGGSHNLDNLQSLCRSCHASKTGREGRLARGGVPGAFPPGQHPGHVSQEEGGQK